MPLFSVAKQVAKLLTILSISMALVARRRLKTDVNRRTGKGDSTGRTEMLSRGSLKSCTARVD